MSVASNLAPIEEALLLCEMIDGPEISPTHTEEAANHHTTRPYCPLQGPLPSTLLFMHTVTPPLKTRANKH